MTNKTVRDAVEHFGGEWPRNATSFSLYCHDDGSWSFCNDKPFDAYFVCTRAQFELESEVWRAEKMLGDALDCCKELMDMEKAGLMTNTDNIVSDEWSGEGLPPTRTICELDGQPTLILGRDGDYFWCKRLKKDKPFTAHKDSGFRPLKTEKEREREDAITAIQKASQGKIGAPISAQQAINLYEAGYHK